MLRRLRHTALKTAATGVVVVGAAEATTHLPSQGRSSDFYHYLCDSVATPIVRTLLNPEEAHNVAVEMARRGWAPRYRPSLPRYASASVQQGRWVDSSCRPFVRDPSLVFPNCVGLAAGFDKDGVAIGGLLEMGFGFVEIGSVTPLPQPGNAKPRMFRLTEDRGVINRYGFNSAGIDQVEVNLKDSKEDLGLRRKFPDANGGSRDEEVYRSVATELEGDFGTELVASIKDYIGVVTGQVKNVALFPRTPQPRGLVGINVGKNKNSDDEVADYVKGIRKLGPHADYIVINISSPNTPGLRNLQRDEPLRRLLKATVSERDALPPRTRKERGSSSSVVQGMDVPLLVKIAPDLSEEERVAIANAVLECRVDGLVVSNTSVSRPDTLLSKHRDERGGLSGAPIRDMSTECIREMYRLTDGKIPIIGVGGVGSGHDAYEKLRAGASLVQVYTMLVYEGPGLVSRIRNELECIMRENGHRRVEDIVGLDHDDIYWKKREERMTSSRSHEPMIVSE